MTARPREALKPVALGSPRLGRPIRPWRAVARASANVGLVVVVVEGLRALGLA